MAPATLELACTHNACPGHGGRCLRPQAPVPSTSDTMGPVRTHLRLETTCCASADHEVRVDPTDRQVCTERSRNCADVVHAVGPTFAVHGHVNTEVSKIPRVRADWCWPCRSKNPGGGGQEGAGACSVQHGPTIKLSAGGLRTSEPNPSAKRRCAPCRLVLDQSQAGDQWRCLRLHREHEEDALELGCVMAVRAHSRRVSASFSASFWRDEFAPCPMSEFNPCVLLQQPLLMRNQR